MADDRAIYPTQPDPSTPIAPTTNYGEARSCTTVKAGKVVPVADCRPTPFHPGIDLVAHSTWRKAHGGSSKGAPVYAPFDGWILYSGPVPNSKDSDVSAWLDGYGPGAVLLAHDDRGDGQLYDPGGNLPWDDAVSFRYTLLAHIKPLFDLPLDPDVRKLQRARFGTGQIDQDKWIPGVLTNQGARRHLTDVMKFEPDSRSALLQGGRYVRKGTVVGEISSAEHTHWEVRTTPFASPGPLDSGKVSLANATELQFAAQQRISPHAWISHHVDIAAHPPPESHVPDVKPESTDSGWGWLLLLGLGLAALDDNKR